MSQEDGRGTGVRNGARIEGVALVTGGGGDLGRAIGAALAAAGARVVLADIDGTKAQASVDAIAETDLTCHAVALDVADPDAVDAVFADVEARHGPVEVLVNNAGKAARRPSTELPVALWNDIIAVNLTGTFLCSRAAARGMLTRRRGAIVNIASIMGVVGNSLYANPAYHASKGGILSLTRAQAAEWAPHGLRVNAIAPAFVDTQLTGRLLEQPGMRDGIVAHTPMGRLAETGEIASAVVFLASPEASYITGATLAVDGGWTAI